MYIALESAWSFTYSPQGLTLMQDESFFSTSQELTHNVHYRQEVDGADKHGRV